MIPNLIRPLVATARLFGVARSQRRVRFLLKHLDREGLGMEIGPSHCPVAPKAKGFKVKILDHLDRESLVRKCLALGADTRSIEEVDYLWEGQPYRDLVGGEEVFDWIISSHSIEHVPDFVGFLDDCRKVLKIGGVLSLAIPNRMCTFDVERENSSLSSIIDAHLRRDTVPTPGAIAEFSLRFANKGGRECWGRWSVLGLLPARSTNPASVAREQLLRRMSNREYVDIHSWCFTPRSFVRIVEDLGRLGILEGMDIIEPPKSSGMEFLVALRRVR